jgi:hypothetical protein
VVQLVQGRMTAVTSDASLVYLRKSAMPNHIPYADEKMYRDCQISVRELASLLYLSISRSHAIFTHHMKISRVGAK